MKQFGPRDVPGELAGKLEERASLTASIAEQIRERTNASDELTALKNPTTPKSEKKARKRKITPAKPKATKEETKKTTLDNKERLRYEVGRILDEELEIEMRNMGMNDNEIKAQIQTPFYIRKRSEKLEELLNNLK